MEFQNYGNISQEGPVAQMDKKPNIKKLIKDNDIEGLIDALEYPSPTIQRKAAEALMYVRDQRIIEPLIRALNNDHEEVKCAAAEVLSLNYNKNATEPLIELLNNKKEQIRITAAKSLGLLRDKKSVEALIQALDDKSSAVRCEAVKALGDCGDERATKHLIPFVENRKFSFGNVLIHPEAIEAVGKIHDTSAIDSLLYVFFNDRDQRNRDRALEALRKICGWHFGNVDAKIGELFIEYKSKIKKN